MVQLLAQISKHGKVRKKLKLIHTEPRIKMSKGDVIHSKQ